MRLNFSLGEKLSLICDVSADCHCDYERAASAERLTALIKNGNKHKSDINFM